MKKIKWSLDEIEKLNIELAEAKKNRDEEVLVENIKKILFKAKTMGLIDYKIMPLSNKIKKNDFVQTYRIDAVENKEAIKKAELADGILVYVTNHTESSAGMFNVHANEIARHYRGKYVIENVFRFLKSFVDLRPMFVWLEDHVAAHIDICMIVAFIGRYIEELIGERGR